MSGDLSDEQLAELLREAPLIPPPALAGRAKELARGRGAVDVRRVLELLDADPDFRTMVAARLDRAQPRGLVIGPPLTEPPRPVGLSETEWLESVRRQERRGELLEAVDLADRGLEEHPSSLWLRHRGVLSLARAGATDRAARLFEQFGMAISEEPEIAALGARIAKDLALGARGEARRRLMLDARDRYAAIHLERPDYYPAINAATLSLVAGEPSAAERYAREALSLAAAEVTPSYYSLVSVAEAHLVLGEPEAAVSALDAARSRHGGDLSALATTRRQLRMVCRTREIDDRVLEALAGPRVAHFCGHLISEAGRFRSDQEQRVAAAMRAALAADPVGIAYGSLAAGGDILWAEALLEAGAELHIVLPFDREAFLASSVVPCGPEWEARFESCLTGAATVSYAAYGGYADDDALFRYGAQLAMGQVLLRARHLDTDAVQLALWDGREAMGAAGTTLDVEAWRATGRRSVVIDPNTGHPPRAAGLSGAAGAHELPAMLVADASGFGLPGGPESSPVRSPLIVAFEAVLDSFGEQVVHQSRFGQTMYVVFASAAAAARCAFALQERLASDTMMAGELQLRIRGHLIPVDMETAPDVESILLAAHEARTQLRTPPTEVYVSEPMAAALELSGERRFACDYVGHLPSAPGRRRPRMHRLSERLR